MFNPISTYRIQFHKGFSFAQFSRIIPYLQNLGISTVYASPIFEAIPGSMHGYDCTNPLAINPEIGTEEELRQISRQLKELGISWIQDIVPNHMAYHPNNTWLMDVLEKGEASEFAGYFDITRDAFNNQKLMVPFLGSPLTEVIQNGELKLVSENGKIRFDYAGNRYPLSTETAEGLTGNLNIGNEELLQVANAQHYRLCHWQETDERINYRRFFTVNALICLNIQNEAVFAHHHSYTKQLMDEGIFQGLRVDHIDGLHNPTAYLQQLRRLCGSNTFIVVEKILEPGEALPQSWPVQGSTGYDFLAIVNNLFTQSKSEAAFTEFYQGLTTDYSSIHQQIRDKKAHILQQHMNGELENLYRLFLRLNIVDKRALSRIPAEDLKSAIGEFLVQCPVYRYYGSRFPLNNEEASAIKIILTRLRRSGESAEAVAVLESVFIHRPHEGNEEVNNRIAQFYSRCMQFTGPLMAKGVEDTLMYTYNRAIGHNEVGDSPEAFGLPLQQFHSAMRLRQQQWPAAMNGTATHDTKRGEDVRGRLNVLTDIPEQWVEQVEEWITMNAALKKEGAPTANDEYLIYQSLIGHYPFEDDSNDDFTGRLQAFIEKALREAKAHSGWAAPNEAYETATKEFALALLNKELPFWSSFQQFLQRLRDGAYINSLAQVLLKFTLPGVPDLYQGCETWDLSFVDPDNRRPVEYKKNEALLKRFEEGSEDLLPALWKEADGGIKLWLTQQLLAIRKSEAGLFAEGDYIPLQTEGKYKEHVLAYARRQGEKTYLFAVPLHTTGLVPAGAGFFKIDWQDTRIVLPKEFGGFSDVLSGSTIAKTEGLLAKNLFKKFTVAILKGRQAAKERSAGILLHITSLPSQLPVGDLGPGAKTFADFLHRSGQKYWQLLPLNPTEQDQGYSPYSALSGKAGWPLLIALEPLVQIGLLSEADLLITPTEAGNKVDYSKAWELKQPLLAKAFTAFMQKNPAAQKNFELFCDKERSWLDDFAVYLLIKNQQNGLPWYQWPDDYKKRNAEELNKLKTGNEAFLQQIKWQQFVFTTQWQELKSYCNNRNIKFIGDMPFYVSYDSADVWAAQELFNLDADGERKGIAGVPPDAFSDDGQLWGMPTFNWPRMKEEGYRWWIQRLRKNRELFDLTRLDHFRAFEAYWEVPAGETTAINGAWRPGPAQEFFKLMQKEFGELPFVAEDLGAINEAVLNLRDEAHLPGMKVLQFAFFNDMPQSAYIPHNYEKNSLVYSGTHDNNTTVGWYKLETDSEMREQLKNYCGQTVNEATVHTVFAKLAYSSVANIAILPMQDVLGLDETARMNKPSSARDNWTWRLLPEQLTSEVEKQLWQWVQLYNR